MCNIANYRSLALEKRFCNQLFAGVLGNAVHCDVDASRFQLIFDVFKCDGLDRYPDVWSNLLKQGNRTRNQRTGKHNPGTNPQISITNSGSFACFLNRMLIFENGTLRVFQERLSSAGQFSPTTMSVDQRDTDLLFQPPDGLGKRRLRDIEFSRSRSNPVAATDLSQLPKGLEARIASRVHIKI